MTSGFGQLTSSPQSLPDSQLHPARKAAAIGKHVSRLVRPIISAVGCSAARVDPGEVPGRISRPQPN
ncbi:MAG TPA: hypothetical protein VG408_09970 [Actinomycetota bacterium]|nr:hypothetical protein [Actinomycetota bacterium]